MFAPVEPVNHSRPYSHGVLILQVMMSLHKLVFGDIRLGTFHVKNHVLCSISLNMMEYSSDLSSH